MGKRSYDLSSNDLDRQDRKQCSSISKSRIAIIVAIVLVAWAAIAGIIAAVYFTSIPAPKSKSDVITRIEVTKVKAYQGEVRIEQDWNESLNDPNSNMSKDKSYNFTSAMDVVCRNNSGYNGTVVDGFRNGSIVVIYRIFWKVIVIQEIDTSAKPNNAQQGRVIGEVETNPVDTANLIKLIKDELPKQLGANVTQILELQEVTTTTATPTTSTIPAATNTTKTTTKETSTTIIPVSSTLQPATSTTLKPTTTTTTTTNEPTIITTATSTTRQPIMTTTTTTTTLKPSASTTTTTTTPKPTTTTRITSTIEPATTNTTITKEPTTTTTTISSTFQPTITTTTTTNTPKSITTTTTTTPYSTIISTTPKPITATTAKPTSTNTTAKPESTTFMTHGPVATPNPCQVSAVTLACQFEDNCLCGYRNLRNDTTWYQRSGHFFKLPRYDHTYGNETGQFMVAYNTSDMAVYYNMLSSFGPGYPYRLEYSNSTLISPRENFTTESCVYFYYYLNGTAVRPNPLSAQLFVYVNGSSGRSLVWYDQINRTVSGWLKGWVPVHPGHAEVIFVAKTITTTTVWPGVVALDDVSVIHKPCPDNPDCGPDTFQCNTTRVCIPVYMQCDGGNDCTDESDEENCISKPDYQVKLINGDGSYGSIAIFYQGLWRPVCMSKYNLTEGINNTVQLACKKVGYTGRYQGAFVNSWHQPVQYAMQVSCSSYNVDISNCSMNLTQTTKSTISCYYYQAAFCSNDECFSGEKLCPMDSTYSNYYSSTKCISNRYFCDGIPDCPGDTDELNCANCSTKEFECTNHECIHASQRCDGTPQCGDKSDEYGCVIVANNMSKIYHSHLSAYIPVCYNNMNDTLADMLCSLSGQGSSSHYQQYTYVLNGTMLTPQSNATIPSLVPGYTVSIEPCYSVLLQCASVECGTTMFDDSILAKILLGRDAVLGQLPWQISLYSNGHFICGGSIIHPNWVITATHCTVYKQSYSVIAGAVEAGLSYSAGYQGQLYNSSQTYNNPLYNSEYDNDITLLHFNQPIVFSHYVRPICIASSRTVDEMLKAGYNTECYVSGWGRYHNLINGATGEWLGKLQVVRVYLYNKEECNQIFYDVYSSYPQNTTVCVDNQNFGAPTCHGDSGGPLICRNKYGRFELLGTLSWGYNSCFKEGYPDIYQLSYPHADWIEWTTGLSFSDLTMDVD